MQADPRRPDRLKNFFALAALLMIGVVSAASAPEPDTVEDLGWLAGCWATIGGEDGSGEQWTRPAGGTMLGVNRTVKNSGTVAYEFMQIRETGDNRIEFFARPSGQAGATFVLMKLSEGEAVFENSGHNFPQRIIYRLNSEGDLGARIEGEVKGRFSAVDFPFKRVDCVAGPDPSAAADELRGLHERVLEAHRNGDLEAWMAVEGEPYVSANNGTISFPGADQRRAAREPYLDSTTFTVYRDLRPPIVRISEDATLGWVIAEVEVRGTRVSDGADTPVEAVWAWIELYENRSGVWKLVGNMSNRRP
jgi:hypothetical protein